MFVIDYVCNYGKFAEFLQKGGCCGIFVTHFEFGFSSNWFDTLFFVSNQGQALALNVADILKISRVQSCLVAL